MPSWNVSSVESGKVLKPKISSFLSLMPGRLRFGEEQSAGMVSEEGGTVKGKIHNRV
jgi:hypothetical protein